MLVIYGIPNCNTVKNALTWLKEAGLDYEFHDFKKKGITEGKLQEWFDVFGWEKVINKKGQTWRKLDPAQQASVVDAQSAASVLVQHTSAIKRPVVEVNGKPVAIGFDDENYRTTLL